MYRLLQCAIFLSLYSFVQPEESNNPSIILNALSVYNNPVVREKRNCGAGGCGGCRGYGCGGGCRGGGCGGGCRGAGCGGCANPCRTGGRLCCDNVAPRPCVGCGLNRGIFPEPVPVAVGAVGVGVGVGTCCACCMPLCIPRCVQFGCGLCGGYGGFDYFDYFG